MDNLAQGLNAAIKICEEAGGFHREMLETDKFQQLNDRQAESHQIRYEVCQSIQRKLIDKVLDE